MVILNNFLSHTSMFVGMLLVVFLVITVDLKFCGCGQSFCLVLMKCTDSLPGWRWTDFRLLYSLKCKWKAVFIFASRFLYYVIGTIQACLLTCFRSYSYLLSSLCCINAFSKVHVTDMIRPVVCKYFTRNDGCNNKAVDKSSTCFPFHCLQCLFLFFFCDFESDSLFDFTHTA